MSYFRVSFSGRKEVIGNEGDKMKSSKVGGEKKGLVGKVRVEEEVGRRRGLGGRRSLESFSLKQFQYLLPHTSYNTTQPPAPPTTVNIGESKD